MSDANRNSMNSEMTVDVLKNLPNNVSVMLRAKHGVGKSALVRQVADELGINFHDVRLSQCEVGDVKGLPVISEDKSHVHFVKPWWWPTDPNSKGIIFFDEINRASMDVQQSVFEICLDYRLDGVPLPPGWRVVAAINDTDDYQVSEMDPALIDRWFMIDFEPTVTEWVSWARKNKIHPAIIQYVSEDGKRLDPPVGSMEPGGIYPSRRSWHRFHTIMEHRGLWKNPDERMITSTAAGCVGMINSIGFYSFFKNNFNKISPEDVVERMHEDKNILKALKKTCMEVDQAAVFADSVLDYLVTNLAPKDDVNAVKEGRVKPHHLENFRTFLSVIPDEVLSKIYSQNDPPGLLPNAWLNKERKDSETKEYWKDSQNRIYAVFNVGPDSN